VRAVHGVAWAAVMTAAPALMARLVPVTRRGEAASVWDLMPSLAQLLMPAVGLLLWTAGGAVPVFALGLALGVGGCLAMLFAISPDEPTAKPTATSSRRMLMLEPSAILPMVIAVLFMSASPLFVIYPPILATQNNIPLPELAIYYPVFGLAMVGSRIVIRKIIDRLPRLGVIVAGALLAIAALIGSIEATSIMVLTVAGALYGAAVGFLVPAMTAAVMDRAPADRMGSAMGTYTIGFQFAGGFGAALWGFIIEQSGFLAAYWLAVAVQVVLLVVALATRRELQHRAATATAL
jgi:predicted MFS family arabinose efflux permease